MGQHGDGRQEQQLPAVYRSACRATKSPAEPMQPQQCRREEEREQNERQHPVGPAPAPLQIGSGAREVGDDIEVGKVGADDQGRGAQCRSLPQAGPRKSGAGQRMTDGVYSSLASMSIWTFPCSAPDTGQPFLAASAALAKPA